MLVMAGPDPAIQPPSRKGPQLSGERSGMDGRVKPGHDDRWGGYAEGEVPHTGHSGSPATRTVRVSAANAS